MFNFTSPVTEQQQQFKSVSDADLFILFDEMPSLTDMNGYSSQAKLELAITVSAIRSEMIYRSLVPVN